MLQIIRDRAQSWIAWVIIILIIIPFALWGINQYFRGGKEVGAATVNGVEISPQHLQQALYQQQQRLRDALGANYRPELFPEAQMKQQVLNGLVEQELLVQTARSTGMAISDGLLAGTIRSLSAFQQDGEFSQELYDRALRARGQTARGFEADVRRDMLAQQFYSAVVRSDFATAAERRALQELRGEQRDIGYLVLPVSNFEGKLEVSDDEVKAFYDAQGKQFMQPEQVTVNYLELSADAIAKGISVTEDELHARYEGQLANYQTPEERRARHILIKVDASADAATVEAARKKAEDILKQLRAGADFAALAKKVSEDPGSATQGGDLGYFGRGMMDKAFESAAFALKVGELSEPVRSAFGFHIIRVDAIRGGTTRPFQEVREQIANEIRNERAEQQYYDKAEKLANLAYEHPDTLDEAARELGLTVQKSEPFSRGGGKGLWANPKLVSAAFSDDVLARGNNSEPVEIGRNHLVVLRVADHQPEALRPLDSVRSGIVAQLRREKAVQKARDAAAGLMQKLQQGADPEKTAQSAGAKWQRNDGVTRDGGKVDAALSRTAFAMPRPAANKVSWQQAITATGDQAVVALYAVHAGATKDGTDDTEELERASGSAGFNAVLNGLRNRAEISISKTAEQ